MQRKPPRRTREKILAQSLRMFNEIGEPNTTTSAIANEMNISPGNLYYHFRNKDDIVNALFEGFEGEIDALLDASLTREVHFEDAWLFLHLLFEAIWKYRFVYRDLNDLLSRNRHLETHFQVILARKMSAARALCSALARSRELHATEREVESLATNMVLVATYWFSFEYVRNARRFHEPTYQSTAMARGAYQVLSMVAPFLSERGRGLFQKLAGEYLKDEQ